jgi:hypothetical protein
MVGKPLNCSHHFVYKYNLRFSDAGRMDELFNDALKW